MLGKLAIRNVRRSARDYLVYVLTMTFITALMFAFNSIIFSPDTKDRITETQLMTALLGLATFFIVIIMAWLINYMVRFMLEKRSREFGTYLLIGMKKKQIARLYMRENMLLGAGSFCMGLLLGVLLKQILMAILRAMLGIDSRLELAINSNCLLLTAGCYAGCYLLALFRCKRRFKKMNIHDLMNAERRNEEVKESHEKVKQWLLPVSLLFLLAFGFWLFFWKNWGTGTMLLFLIGLVLVIYLFYTGLSSWIICYVRRKGNRIYEGQNLFLLRQFSSKIKAMRFTMGTLTALFTIALLGSTIALMFSDYEKKMLGEKFPFDVQVYSEYVDDDFAAEMEVLRKETTLGETHIYRIYENETNPVNIWLFTHLRAFGTIYQNEDGSPNMKKIEQDSGNGSFYCKYDTYMGLSDYNCLRRMLGYPEVVLDDGEYLIHIKKRILNEVGDFSKDLHLQGRDGELTCAGFYAEPFSQDGHNGADYMIVVPDLEIEVMTPFYSEFVADIQGNVPYKLQEHLDALGENQDFAGHPMMEGNYGCGSDTIVNYSADNLVRENLIPEVTYILSSVVFPMFYIGLVFLCVAFTVLSVQQLSDSAKYKFRYGVLGKMGLGRKEVAGIILKQLFGYYLCPALFAAVIGGIIAVFISSKFILYTGVQTPVIQYFGLSFLLFFGIYGIYFAATYVGFKRNVRVD